ncbi:MAG: hypothetical protein ACPL5F_13485 [Moorellaceae bacterium]
MKVYQVKMNYFDGDHDHGYYQSPLFLKREDAEAFKQKLIELAKTNEDDNRIWWSQWGWDTVGPEEAYITEIEVIDNWDGVIKPADDYLHITYT